MPIKYIFILLTGVDGDENLFVGDLGNWSKECWPVRSVMHWVCQLHCITLHHNQQTMNVYYHIMKQKQNISFKEINDTKLQILLLHFSSASATL